jgi:hypothetical protein
VDAGVSCILNSVWTGSICAPLPAITITPTPSLVRSGSQATLNITVNSNFDLRCTVVGGVTAAFDHIAQPTMFNHPPLTTAPLTSATVVSITCVSAANPLITAAASTRVNVVPIVQEI